MHPSHCVAAMHSQHRVSRRAACTVAHCTTVAMHVGARRAPSDANTAPAAPACRHARLPAAALCACVWVLLHGCSYQARVGPVCVSSPVGHLWRHCPGGWGWGKVYLVWRVVRVCCLCCCCLLQLEQQVFVLRLYQSDIREVQHVV